METTIITISKPKHFSFSQVLSFLDRGFDDCLYRLGKNSVSRIISLSDGIAFIKIIDLKTDLEIELRKEIITQDDKISVERYVKDWFDLDRDIQPFYDLLQKVSPFADFPTKFAGLRIIGIPDLFEAICWAIIGQQINLTFAYKTKRLLVEKYGEKKQVDGHIFYLFPTPKILLHAKREDLEKLKFSRQKINYIKNVSIAFEENRLNKIALINAANQTERIEQLTAIKGIGIWTANYVLMKCLRDKSCITYGDSGLNKAIHLLFNTDKRPSKETVDKIFANFKGWESYLNFYLWKTLTPS